MCEKETVPYCYIADKKYAELLIISINSLLRNQTKNRKLLIYVIVENEEEIDRAAFLKRIVYSGTEAKIVWKIGKRPDLAYVKNHSNLTSIVFIKFLLPELFHNKHKFIFYLDCDTLLFGDPANSIQPDKEKSIMACRDIHQTWDQAYHENAENIFEEISGAEPYLNSGVMLLNVDKLIELKFFDKCCGYQMKYLKQKRFQDQDCINLAALGQWSELPSKFNIPVDSLFVRPLWKRALLYKKTVNMPGDKIIHFAGPYKMGRGGLFQLPIRWAVEQYAGKKISPLDVVGYILEAFYDDLFKVWKRMDQWWSRKFLLCQVLIF